MNRGLNICTAFLVIFSSALGKNPDRFAALRRFQPLCAKGRFILLKSHEITVTDAAAEAEAAAEIKGQGKLPIIIDLPVVNMRAKSSR